MNFHGFCPQCNTQIPQERYATGFAICECGWHDPANEKKKNKADEKMTIAIMVGVFAGIALFLGHAISWGPYAFSIPLTKIQQVTGTLSNQGHLELASACIGLNKWSCAQDAYIDLYERSADPLALAKLAHLQDRLGDDASAVATYATYLKAGGRDGEAMTRYARLLEGAGRADEAMAMYESSIEARPDVLSVHATSGIVRILMKQGRYEEARERILAFHESAGNARGYLNTELAQLESYLSEHASSKSTVKPKARES